MRTLLLLWLYSVTLFGYSYDRLLLEAEASVFPKLLLLTQRPSSLLVDGKLRFVIFHEEADRPTAETLRETMLRQYHQNDNPYALEVRIVPFSQSGNVRRASAVMALYASERYADVVHLARSMQIPSFVFDAAYLNEGFLFSLSIEHTVTVYLNASELKQLPIVFSGALYQIVRLYDASATSSIAF